MRIIGLILCFLLSTTAFAADEKPKPAPKLPFQIGGPAPNLTPLPYGQGYRPRAYKRGGFSRITASPPEPTSPPQRVNPQLIQPQPSAPEEQTTESTEPPAEETQPETTKQRVGRVPKDVKKMKMQLEYLQEELEEEENKKYLDKLEDDKRFQKDLERYKDRRNFFD